MIYPKNSFILLLFTDLEYFPIRSSTESIRSLYTELWLNSTTPKGEFQRNSYRQYFSWGEGE